MALKIIRLFWIFVVFNILCFAHISLSPPILLLKKGPTRQRIPGVWMDFCGLLYNIYALNFANIVCFFRFKSDMEDEDVIYDPLRLLRPFAADPLPCVVY